MQTLADALRLTVAVIVSRNVCRFVVFDAFEVCQSRETVAVAAVVAMAAAEQADQRIHSHFVRTQ